MPKFPRNRDGGQWRLCWEPKDGGFRAWVESYPEVEVFAQSWKDAQQALYNAVDEKLHAGEWTADWFPPPPVDERYPYAVHPDYVMLVPNGTYALEGGATDYYSDGCCEKCRRVKGRRTDRALSVRVETLAGIMFIFGMRTGLRDVSYLYRAETIELLGGERLAGAQVRDVVRLDLGRSTLFEVLAFSDISPVAVKGMKLFGGKCKVCDSLVFSHHLGGGDYVTIFRRDDIPSGVASFWVTDHDSRLCVRRDWWGQVRGHKAFRGVISNPVYVVEQAYVDENPQFPAR